MAIAYYKTFYILFLPGIVDSSGIEFFYTKQKPRYEAGGISVALPIIPLMIIPPKMDIFRHSATCLPSCTDQVSDLTITWTAQ